jgi:hypothetical protein
VNTAFIHFASSHRSSPPDSDRSPEQVIFWQIEALLRPKEIALGDERASSSMSIESDRIETALIRPTKSCCAKNTGLAGRKVMHMNVENP